MVEYHFFRGWIVLCRLHVLQVFFFQSISLSLGNWVVSLSLLVLISEELLCAFAAILFRACCDNTLIFVYLMKKFLLIYEEALTEKYTFCSDRIQIVSWVVLLISRWVQRCILFCNLPVLNKFHSSLVCRSWWNQWFLNDWGFPNLPVFSLWKDECY